jgi:hypothetical protein
VVFKKNPRDSTFQVGKRSRLKKHVTYLYHRLDENEKHSSLIQSVLRDRCINDRRYAQFYTYLVGWFYTAAMNFAPSIALVLLSEEAFVAGGYEGAIMSTSAGLFDSSGSI